MERFPSFLMPINAFSMTFIDGSSGCRYCHMRIQMMLHATIGNLCYYLVTLHPCNGHRNSDPFMKRILDEDTHEHLASAHVGQLDPALWCCWLMKCIRDHQHDHHLHQVHFSFQRTKTTQWN